MLALTCLSDIRFTKKENIPKLSKRGSLASIRNRCLITGRSVAVYSKLRLSRIKFREYALFGFITGIRKAAW